MLVDCLLVVVRCVLSIVDCCVLFVVWSVFIVARCLLLGVVVSCSPWLLSFDVCCLMYGVGCWLVVVVVVLYMCVGRCLLVCVSCSLVECCLLLLLIGIVC